MDTKDLDVNAWQLESSESQSIGSLDARIDLAHKEAADENAEEDGPECCCDSELFHSVVTRSPTMMMHAKRCLGSLVSASTPRMAWLLHWQLIVLPCLPVLSVECVSVVFFWASPLVLDSAD